MKSSLRRSVVLFMLASCVTGCASPGFKSECPCATESSRAKAADLSEQRLMLSEGYSLLYQDAGNLGLINLILYVKAESSELEALVRAVDEFATELKKDLERIARDYPGVRIDLDPLPEMEKRKRRAIAKDRALDFLPVVGKGGREYERTVLIGLYNGFNHERHLCQVMAAEEPDPGLKKFLIATQKRYDGLYDRAVALLENEHVRNPRGESKD